MIIWDTETTDLVKPKAARLSDQPKMIEFAAIKLDDVSYNEVDRLTFFCNPGEPLDAKIIKITGITDAMLKAEKPFIHNLPKLVDFFLGERYSFAHNHAFDSNILTFDLQRVDYLTRFPWCPHQICTVEATFSIKGRRMNLSSLHEYLFGKPFDGAHRAMGDVQALSKCVVELIKKGVIKLP